MNKEYIETPTIGEIIREEFLEPLDITPYRLSKELKVSTSTILDLLHNKRKITVEMALRLSKYFGNSYKFWLNLQNELEIREAKKKMGTELDKIHAFRLIIKKKISKQLLQPYKSFVTLFARRLRKKCAKPFGRGFKG